MFPFNAFSMLTFLFLNVVIFTDVSITEVINLPFLRYQSNLLGIFISVSLSCVIGIIIVIFITRKLISENSSILDKQIMAVVTLLS